MQFSIILPTFNEESSIKASLKPLQILRLYGGDIIVADGGSTDKTKEACEGLIDTWVDAEKGRASQMNAGAEAAKYPIMMFLHADTVLPNNFIHLMQGFEFSTSIWGRFDVRLSGCHKMYPVIATMMNWRSKLTGIATGDQAIFVRRTYFDRVGGFPDQPLMEDVEFSKKLKKIAKPYCISSPLTTNSRRWERYGVWKTILLMWSIRFKYLLGAKPEKLYKQYYP